MSLQIETAWVQQFRANFDMLAQQMDARLPATVTVDTLAAEIGYRDQIGAVDAVQRTTRHGDTPFTEVPHARRQFQADDWEVGEIIDRQDTQRMLTSPQSAYAQAFAAGFNRRRDITILRAMFATARIGKTGADTVAFPAGQAIAVDYVESGSATNSGMTIPKLRRALEILADAEASDGQLTIACSQRELNGLLRTVEVGSSDYNNVKALVNAEVNTFMGFTFVRLPSARFELDGSSHRRIPAYHKAGVLYAQMAETDINAAPDPTKGFNTRIHGRASFGATRLEEARVVEIKCSTSVF